MRKAFFAAALAFCGTLLQAQQIRGDYIESRSTDVYVAQCFANGEVGLTGNQALLAWHVQEGSWNGVKLDGLTVAAAVRGTRHSGRSLRRSVSGASGADGRRRSRSRATPGADRAGPT